MQEIIEGIVSLGIPWVDETVARLIVLFIFGGIVASVPPAMLIILTWLERKIIARIQDRVGPNRAGPYGLFQGVADMVKMFIKEDIVPAKADPIVFNLAPGLATVSSIMAFAIIPFAPGFAGTEMNAGLLYIIAAGGLGTLAILMAGWASNNKYALLGAFRSVAMLLSYEIPMVLALIVVASVAGSMSLVDIVDAQFGMWYIIPLPLAFLIFFIAGVAETGRSPFDLIEAESELVAGFHTEYSGLKFGLFMIGEYVHMFVLAFFTAVLFLGGWHIPFINLGEVPAPFGPILGFMALLVKVFLFVFIMMWMRGTLPRFRIDQVLDFGWKFLVPVSIALVMVVMVVVRLFSSGENDLGLTVVPGPLAWFGFYGEVFVLLLANIAIGAATLGIVWLIARTSRNEALRAVSAIKPTST